MKIEVEISAGGISCQVKGFLYSDNGLNMWEWDSHYSERYNKLVVTSYYKHTKQTKRHKWKVEERYSVFDKRRNTLGMDRLPVVFEVGAEMVRKFRESVGITYDASG